MCQYPGEEGCISWDSLCEAKKLIFLHPTNKLPLISHWPELGHKLVRTHYLSEAFDQWDSPWNGGGQSASPEATWREIGCLHKTDSVRKEERRYECWLGIRLQSLPSIKFTIIIFIITLSVISLCFGLLACPVLFLFWESWLQSYLAFSVCAGLSLVPASADERATKTYHFCFQLSFPSQKYLQPSC